MKLHDNFYQVVIRKIARVRDLGMSFADERYEVLAMPHEASPFLTLAEWPKQVGKEFPQQVIKVLVLPLEDRACGSWKEILKSEKKYWRSLFDDQLKLPEDVAKFGLPLAPAGKDQQGKEEDGLPVEIAEVGPIRRLEILDGEADLGGADLRFSYLTRPYIPLPCLQEVGFSSEQKSQKWRTYCEQRGFSEATKEDDGLFEHFCQEALVRGPNDFILTSVWRFDFFAEKSS